MATNKNFYAGSSRIGPDASLTVNAIAGAVTLNLVEPLDWGTPDREIYEWERPSYGDGTLPRGDRWKPRDAVVTIGGRVNANLVGVANVEAYRDDAMDAVLDLLSPAGQTEWKVTRTNAAGTAVARMLKAKSKGLPSWEWSPDSYGPGLVGRHDNPHFVVPVGLHANFPWWLDAGATLAANFATSTFSPGGGSGTVNFTSYGTRHLGSGIQVAVYGNDTVDLAITLTPTGAPAVTSPMSVGFDNVTLTPGTAYIVDSYYSDPVVLDFFTGVGGASSGVSAWDKLVLGSRDLIAYPGSNAVQVAWSGSPANNITVEVRWQGWWGKP